jgi:DNA-binding transcriptional ArsR family regulator
MHAAAERVSDLMKVLSNKHRLLILCQLVEHERSVGELAERVGIREQATSQQLALLRKDGLVRTRREGQTIYYALAREDIGRLMAFLYEAYCGPEAPLAAERP